MVLKNIIDYPVSSIADLFAKVEKELDEYGQKGEIFLMSDFTSFMYKCCQIQPMLKKRRENERYLKTLIKSPYLRPALTQRDENECPFNMPMYCSCRDDMWTYPVEILSIYPSVLWRTYLYDPVKYIGNTAKMGKEIISFPIDQRYSKEDMDFIAEAVNS